MKRLKEGLVVWFRGDGTGYIRDLDSPGYNIIVHYSAIAKDHSEKKSLKTGEKVFFKYEDIMGRKVATYVERRK